MDSRLREKISSLLKIRPEEGRMVVRLTGLMFFSSAGGAIGSPGVEALFFDRFGVQFLPHMYIVLGLATLTTSLAITAVLGKLDRKQFYSGLPVVMGLTLAGERFLLIFDQKWFFPMLWLSMNIFWVLQSLFAWGIAGLICDMRQSKRLFPLFGAGSTLGLAVGGVITRPLVGWIGTENLLLAWIAGLALSFLLARSLLGRVERRPGSRFKSRPSFIEEIQTSLRSPLLRWISLAAVLFAVLWYSVVFPFSKAASANFPDDRALAGFLGVFQGLAMAAAILVSLIAAGRIYARLGFITAILIYPVLYGFGFIALAVFASFPILAVFRFSQIVWSEGISEEANQALFNVVPQKEREQSRAFVRGIANQIGVSLAGLLLLFSEQPVFQSFNLYYLDAVAAGGAALLIWKARKAYRQAIVGALRAGQPQIFFPEEEPFGGFKRDADAVSIVIAGIGSPDPTIRLVSAEILGEIAPVEGIEEGIEAAVLSLEDSDPYIRAALLRAIGRSGTSLALREVADCLEDPVPEVRIEAIEALRGLDGYPRELETQIRACLEDPHPAVRAHAAAALLQKGLHPSAEQVLYSMAHSEEVEFRVEAMKALPGWGSPEAFQLAATALEDPFPAVRREAAGALTKIDPQQCLDVLIRTLGDEDFSVKEAAAQALGKVGPQAVGPLISALSNLRIEEGALLAMRHLPVHTVSKDLRAYALENVNRALRYHRLWLEGISQQYIAEEVKFAADSLREKSLQSAEHALIAISLLGDADSVDLALENLKSSSTEQTATALEMLESLGEPMITGPLFRLWEPPERYPPPPMEQWLVELLEDADPWLRACAVLAGKKTGILQEEFLENLSKTDPDHFVREIACPVLEEGPGMKTLPTIPLMERIFFLRRVSLFANLKPPDLKAIGQMTGEHIFAPGEMIAEQGEPGDEMFIVVSGEVEVVMGQGKGKEKQIARRKPGEVVGEMALISQEPRMASLVAVGEVRALCIEQDKFIEMLRLRPETSLAVMRILCQRLRESLLVD